MKWTDVEVEEASLSPVPTSSPQRASCSAAHALCLLVFHREKKKKRSQILLPGAGELPWNVGCGCAQGRVPAAARCLDTATYTSRQLVHIGHKRGTALLVALDRT
jgi:hypothetical protein